MQLRYEAGGDFNEVLDVFDAFLTAIDAGIYEITIEGARHRADGATISLPITWAFATTYGTTTALHNQTAQYYDWIGRSTGGRRVRLTVFGAITGYDVADDDYRVAATGIFEDGRDVLVGAADLLVAIDNAPIVWYNYVNLGQNAYWRNRVR
jgi:hypothetical protein